MTSVGLTSFNSGNHFPVHQTASLPQKNNVVDNKTSSLSKTLFKGAALLGLAMGGAAALYYARNSFVADTSQPDAFKPDASKLPELPKNICSTPQYAHMCENNLGIPRINMPQIEGEVKNYFLGSYRAAGVNITHTVKDAKELRPIQNEMNEGKVLKMVADYKAGKFDPCEDAILITVGDKGPNGEQVNYVADGHHRFAACYLLDRPMNVIAINDQAQNVLNKANSFPGVTKADL